MKENKNKLLGREGFESDEEYVIYLEEYLKKVKRGKNRNLISLIFMITFLIVFLIKGIQFISQGDMVGMLIVLFAGVVGEKCFGKMLENN